jgi:ribosomal protein S15P/S13E
LTIIFSALAASLVLGLSIKMPESPYWLAMNGKVQAAYESLRSFRETEVIAARDLYQIYITDEQNNLRNGNLTWPKPFPRPSELLTNNRLRVIVIANIAFMITRVFSLTQHLSVFALDMSSTFNLYATSVRNILSCCAPVLLTFLVDRLARRHMLISLLWGMFVLMLVPLLTSNQVASLISKSCFFILFSVGELAFSIYIAEAFPLYHRGKAPIGMRENTH